MIKDIPDYPNYSITTSGIVFNKKKGKPVKWFKSSSGYWEVDLSKDGTHKRFSVHRLVAIVFIPNPNNLPEVNHKDGNRLNPDISNLEWVTGRQNIRHGFVRRNGSISSPKISLDKIKQLNNRAKKEGLDLYTLIVKQLED